MLTVRPRCYLTIRKITSGYGHRHERVVVRSFIVTQWTLRHGSAYAPKLFQKECVTQIEPLGIFALVNTPLATISYTNHECVVDFLAISSKMILLEGFASGKCG
jgi:hypothetical protein